MQPALEAAIDDAGTAALEPVPADLAARVTGMIDGTAMPWDLAIWHLARGADTQQPEVTDDTGDRA